MRFTRLPYKGRRKVRRRKHKKGTQKKSFLGKKENQRCTTSEVVHFEA
jgi:hypothetical protein